MRETLLSEIEQFLAETGMKDWNFGFAAVKNGRLVENLRKTRKNGMPSRVWPETEYQVRAFMLAERHARASKRQAEPASTETTA